MFILLIFSALIFHCLSLEGMWKAFIVCFAAQRIKKVKQFWQQVQLLRMKQLKLVNWYRKRAGGGKTWLQKCFRPRNKGIYLHSSEKKKKLHTKISCLTLFFMCVHGDDSEK